MKEMILNTVAFVIKKVAIFTSASLSMIGMYEPECPEELK